MKKTHVDVVVIGSGPGGYAAAFYAADLGKNVMLIEKDPQLGGVCLNRGCIPSKALLNATKMVSEAKKSAKRGISFGEAKIDLPTLRDWKKGVLEKLSGGVSGLAKLRGVQVVFGRGYFNSGTELRVETEAGQQFVTFDQAIIAVGSRPALPAVFDLGNPRIMTSTEALDVPDVPEKLLVVGGGYIGMELGTVYAGLGSKVTVIEAAGAILAGADADLARPVVAYAKEAFEAVMMNTKILKMATVGKQIKVTIEAEGQKSDLLFDRVLVSVGRVPNSDDLGLENTKVQLDDRKFIQVNAQQQTAEPTIFAIGDIAGGLLLAHKASREARIAVEAIVGETSIPINDVVIPAVVFTEPEVAWCGLTESEAKAQGRQVKVAKFSWGASGRALSMDKPEGLTKLVVDPVTERLLGVGIVGPHAGDLIGEGVLALEMGATVKDLAMSVHPHPTLSETMMEAAELFYGHCTHAFSKKA